MPPETTYDVTIGEVARRLEAIDKGQVAILARMESHPALYVTRVEWDLYRDDARVRSVPWTAVVSLLVAGLALLGSLGVIGQ